MIIKIHNKNNDSNNHNNHNNDNIFVRVFVCLSALCLCEYLHLGNEYDKTIFVWLLIEDPANGGWYGGCGWLDSVHWGGLNGAKPKY